MVMVKRKGFTLIELLVVIAIIALLMSIMMPALAQVQKMAKAAICLSNLKQWSVVWELYVDMNEGKFMGDEASSWSLDDQLRELYKGKERAEVRLRVLNANPGLSGSALEIAICQGLFEENKLRFCPLAKKTMTEGGKNPLLAWREPDYEDAPLGSPEGETGSYVTNLWVGHSIKNVRTVDKVWTTPTVKNAGLAPMMMDGSNWYQNVVPMETDVPPPTDGAVQSSNNNEMWRVCIDRHGGGSINMLFVDFSARKFRIKRLWQLKWNRKWITPLHPDEIPGPDGWPAWMQAFPE